MRSHRFGLLVGLLVAAIAVVSPPAAQAAFGVEEHNFEAGTCQASSCTYASIEADPSGAYTQAAGHPPVGLTAFEFNSEAAGLGKKPIGSVKNIRVDLPPGLAGNPEALPKCSLPDFEKNACAADTKVGSVELTVFASLTDITIPGTVYNLQQPPGLALDFGIAVSVEPLVNVHIFLEGHVSWSSDYHEYFEINNVPKEGEIAGLPVALSVLKSKLIFEGQAGAGNFLTLPSACSSSTTSHLRVESYEGQVSETSTHTPLGVTGCDKVPFKPAATVIPATAQSDQPDGATVEVKVPQQAGASEINTADIRDAHVTLPEGLTLNPPAAHGLQACTSAQIAIGTAAATGNCPAASRVGTVTIETDLPPGSLTGGVYLGSPDGSAITGPPYTVYLDAESEYGVSVRLKGLVTPNPATGRLEATFTENPQLPFSVLRMSFNGGPLAPLANPLVCGSASGEGLFTPYTGQAAALSSSPFVTSGCPNPLPFSLGQGTQDASAAAGASTSYTLNLARGDGQQYLSQIKTVLPAGLVGLIPAVPLCGEAQANAGSCPSASQIGSATVAAGAGAAPYAFSGPVFLTGPYNGGPYGLSVVVPAVAGPFNLGLVVARAAINVDPSTARVIVTGSVPTIVKGVPLRLREISISIARPGFLRNPTNCGALTTDSTLTSTFNATQSLSSPFQVAACGALAFKPSFQASTGGRTVKVTGAGLRVSLTQGAGQANPKSVVVQLPKQLPARLTTLQKACPEATYAANPFSCPAGSLVGSATVATPVLPGRLTGPAYLVSHGGAAFPDLDLLLQGDGVRVILVGNTNIKGTITTSTFASIPDVPVSSFALDLPTGPHSALATNGSLCSAALLMPTTITAQSGAQIKQSTRVSVSNCGVRIVSHRVVGHKLVLRIKAFAAGRISVKGKNLRTVFKRLGKAATTTVKVPLARGGLRALHGRRRLKLHVRVGFVPRLKGESNSAASTTARFR
jgi:hypothetical protein